MKQFFAIFALVLFLLAGATGLAQAADHFRSFRIDDNLHGQVNFTLPVAATDYWIRLVTHADIPSNSFEFRISNADGVSAIFSVNNANPVYENTDGDPVATINLEHSPAGHPNVYQIHIQPQNVTNNNMVLDIENNAGQLVIFAAYLNTDPNNIDGANPWIRDNATQDQAGNLLNDINNLDDMSRPTNSEFWKSPDVRLSDANGDPTLNPVAEQNNTVSVFVNNYGTTNLGSVIVEAFWTRFSAGLPAFDSGEWVSLGQNTVSDIDPGRSKAAVFNWLVPPVPATGPNHYCIFVRISSGTSNGPLDLDPIDYSANNVNTLTSLNNNAAHRNVKIVTSNDMVNTGTPPFFFLAPARFFITNPFKEARQAEIRIKGLPMIARATDLNIELKAKDRPVLKGMDFASREIRGRIDPRHTASTGLNVNHLALAGIAQDKPASVKLRITNPADLRLGGLQLEAGEQRLVELNLGLTDTLKGGDRFTIDVENVIDGKVIGGITQVYDLQPPKPEPPSNKWKLIAIILGVLLLLLFPVLTKRK